MTSSSFPSSSFPFVVDHVGLAAWLVCQGFEYRLAGERKFAFAAEAEAAAKSWRTRAEARGKSTSSVTNKQYLAKGAR